LWCNSLYYYFIIGGRQYQISLQKLTRSIIIRHSWHPIKSLTYDYCCTGEVIKYQNNMFCLFHGVFDTTLCDKVSHWLGIPVSSINKTDRHGIAEILLKVALNVLVYIYTKVKTYERIYSNTILRNVRSSCPVTLTCSVYGIRLSFCLL
jgi:hypothetical protein